MAGIDDTLASLLGMETDASRAETEARDAATKAWQDQMANQAGGYDLAGFGMSAGQPTSSFRAKNPDMNEAQLQQAWAQQQMSSNPLMGLQVAQNSQMAGVQADPNAMRSQMNALGQLEGIAKAGGYTQAERAQIANANRDAGNVARSNRLAAQSQAEARGMGSGGASLAGALMAQQGGANQAAYNANNAAIAGQQRALQAMEGAGAMAGQIRGQGFGEASQRASAADAWNRGNTNLIMQRQQSLAQGNQAAAGNQIAATQGYTGQQNVNAQALQADQDALMRNIQTIGSTVGSFYGGGGGGGGG